MGESSRCESRGGRPLGCSSGTDCEHHGTDRPCGVADLPRSAEPTSDDAKNHIERAARRNAPPMSPCDTVSRPPPPHSEERPATRAGDRPVEDRSMYTPPTSCTGFESRRSIDAASTIIASSGPNSTAAKSIGSSEIRVVRSCYSDERGRARRRPRRLRALRPPTVTEPRSRARQARKPSRRPNYQTTPAR